MFLAKKLFYIFFIFIILLRLIICPVEVFAFSEYFREDFNSFSLDLSKWFSYKNDGNILFDGNYITLQSKQDGVYNKFPYVKSIINPIPQTGDFTLYTKIKKSALRPFGTSLAFSTQQPVNGVLADINVNPVLYQSEQFINLVLRQTDLLIVFCGSCYDIPCNSSLVQNVSIPAAQVPSDLNFKITYFDKYYKIYLNNSPDPLITSTKQVNQVPNGIWFGSPYVGGWMMWTPIGVDYIYVEKNSSSPLVFLPGYLASFNWEDMVSGRSEHQWTRNPLEKVYDNLFATLNNVGYTEGANLFRYDYDFRRPLAETAAKFKTYLENLAASQPAGTKFVLVGHSFGGLLARTYTQMYGDSLVEKVITVGSPHEGTLDAYPMIAGGESNDPNLANKAVFETVLRWHGKNFLTKRKVVQNLIPSANELVPIYNNSLFLKDEGGNFISSEILNPTLPNLKSTFNQPYLFSIVRGIGKSTNQYFNLQPRTFINTLLDDWPDGIITGTQKSTEGDGTVLAQSANISGVITYDISDADHQDIVSKQAGIKKILDAAGIPYTDDKIVEKPVVSPDRAMLLLLKSPAEIKVTDTQTGKQIGRDATDLIDNAIATESNKLIYIPTENEKTYRVEVIGTGAGEYQFDIGAISIATSSSFLTFKQQTANGKNDTYDFKYSEGGNLVYLTDNTIINPYESAKNMLDDLQNFVATQSAVEKGAAALQIDDLKADCDLIKKLYEVRLDESNSLRQTLKMLVKTFALRENLNQFEREDKIAARNKTVTIIKMQKEMFKIINNNSGFYNLTDAARSINISEKLLPQVAAKLEIDPTISEFDAENFTRGNDFYLEAQKEFASSLAGQAHFSALTSRFFLNESLNP